jgi:hypothetical protein
LHYNIWIFQRKYQWHLIIYIYTYNELKLHNLGLIKQIPWPQGFSKLYVIVIVVTYEIRVFFEGAQKEVFSSIFFKKL